MKTIHVPQCTNNHGYQFEVYFYEMLYANLQRLQTHSVNNILHENDLKRMYGWDAASVDFLIELENGIIPIQCKFRNTRRRENNGIENFVKSIQYISKCSNQPILFGLWISRLEPFCDNKERLKNYKVKWVSEFASMNELSTSACSYLMNMICNM